MQKITLKAARTNKGLTQAEAAKMIGVNPSSLTKYERGVTEPSVSTIDKILLIYDMRYEEIRWITREKAYENQDQHAWESGTGNDPMR